MFIPVVPHNAPKRFYPVNALTGLDAFVGVVMPRAFVLRWIAVKILRASGEIDARKSVLGAMFSRPRLLPLHRDASLGFQYQGQVLLIANTAGRVEVA